MDNPEKLPTQYVLNITILWELYFRIFVSSEYCNEIWWI